MSRIRVFIWVHKTAVVVTGILVLLLTLSFGIGYLLGKQANPAPIIIEKSAG